LKLTAICSSEVTRAVFVTERTQLGGVRERNEGSREQGGREENERIDASLRAKNEEIKRRRKEKGQRQPVIWALKESKKIFSCPVGGKKVGAKGKVGKGIIPLKASGCQCQGVRRESVF